MGRSKANDKFIKVIEGISNLLPMMFWVLILFSFEEPFLATVTLISAFIHELGHILCILLMGKSFGIRGEINGFRIKNSRIKSYGEEILIYLSGPLANVFCSVLFFVFSNFATQDLSAIGLINLATGLSNLLPIRGYDGYGALSALIKKQELSNSILDALSACSTALILALCVFSLYLIDRYNGGYWIFAVFFASMIKEIKLGLDKCF